MTIKRSPSTAVVSLCSIVIKWNYMNLLKIRTIYIPLKKDWGFRCEKIACYFGKAGRYHRKEHISGKWERSVGDRGTTNSPLH